MPHLGAGAAPSRPAVPGLGAGRPGCRGRLRGPAGGGGPGEPAPGLGGPGGRGGSAGRDVPGLRARLGSDGGADRRGWAHRRPGDRVGPARPGGPRRGGRGAPWHPPGRAAGQRTVAQAGMLLEGRHRPGTGGGGVRRGGRRRGRGDVRARLDRRPAGDPAHRGTGRGHARRVRRRGVPGPGAAGHGGGHPGPGGRVRGPGRLPPGTSLSWSRPPAPPWIRRSTCTARR